MNPNLSPEPIVSEVWCVPIASDWEKNEIVFQ